MSKDKEQVLTELKKLPDQRYAAVVKPLYEEVWKIREELEEIHKEILSITAVSV